MLDAAAVVVERHLVNGHVDDLAGGPQQRTLRTCSLIKRPWKCALPQMAPPTVPGVPAHASRPARPRPASHRTSPLIVTPASTRTLSGPSCATSPPWTRRSAHGCRRQRRSHWIRLRGPSQARRSLSRGEPRSRRQSLTLPRPAGRRCRPREGWSAAPGARRARRLRLGRCLHRLDEGTREVERSTHAFSLARASCSSSARTAAAWSTNSKRTSSAGASWAAWPRSAVMTRATTG